MKTVLFVNFSQEDFVGKWDKVTYPFAPGKSQYMEEWKAYHFAKHLVNRELLKKGYENDTSPKRPEDSPRFMELFKKAVLDQGLPEMPASQIETELLNKNSDVKEEEKQFCESCDSKGGRHKKECTKSTRKSEEEFEGLKA
ncbi:MAG: hypothetical protein HYZ51_02075 [Candidatus Doudnabacteria bacterium]|nr:hypothetical protein [Candidatus Doudnabacteria bacterium]